MKCEEITEILSGYVDGEARGDEGRLAEEHLAACARCRDLARRMRLVGAGIERTEGAVPPDFRETLFSRMEREGLLSRRRSLFVYSVRWAAVPVAAAAVLALFVLTSRETGREGPPSSAGTPQAVGQRAPMAREAQQRPPAADGQVQRAQDAPELPRVAQPAPEARMPAARAGKGAEAVADSRAGRDLTPEERDIVAHLDILEDPSALDEPAEIDDLEIVEPAVRSKG